MITQKTLRSILPGKIAKTVILIAERDHQDPLAALKSFYYSPTYAQLEREESKYWWLSPEQLAGTV